MELSYQHVKDIQGMFHEAMETVDKMLSQVSKLRELQDRFTTRSSKENQHSGEYHSSLLLSSNLETSMKLTKDEVLAETEEARVFDKMSNTKLPIVEEILLSGELSETVEIVKEKEHEFFLEPKQIEIDEGGNSDPFFVEFNSSPKTEFPKFDGTSCEDWLLRFENLKKRKNLAEINKSWAASFIEQSDDQFEESYASVGDFVSATEMTNVVDMAEIEEFSSMGRGVGKVTEILLTLKRQSFDEFSEDFKNPNEENMTQIFGPKVFLEVHEKQFVIPWMEYFELKISKHATLVVLRQKQCPSPEPPPVQDSEWFPTDRNSLQPIQVPREIEKTTTNLIFKIKLNHIRVEDPEFVKFSTITDIFGGFGFVKEKTNSDSNVDGLEKAPLMESQLMCIFEVVKGPKKDCSLHLLDDYGGWELGLLGGLVFLLPFIPGMINEFDDENFRSTKTNTSAIHVAHMEEQLLIRFKNDVIFISEPTGIVQGRDASKMAKSDNFSYSWVPQWLPLSEYYYDNSYNRSLNMSQGAKIYMIAWFCALDNIMWGKWAEHGLCFAMGSILVDTRDGCETFDPGGSFRAVIGCRISLDDISIGPLTYRTILNLFCMKEHMHFSLNKCMLQRISSTTTQVFDHLQTFRFLRATQRGSHEAPVERLQKLQDLSLSSITLKVAASKALVGIYPEYYQEDVASALADLAWKILGSIKKEIRDGGSLKILEACIQALKGLTELICGNPDSAKSILEKAHGDMFFIGNAALCYGELFYGRCKYSFAKELYGKLIQSMSETKIYFGDPNNFGACNMTSEEVLIAATCSFGQRAHMGEHFSSHHPKIGVILNCIALMYRLKVISEHSSSLLIQEELFRRSIKLLKAPPLGIDGASEKVHKKYIISLARGGYAETIGVQQSRKAEAKRSKKWNEAGWENRWMTLGDYYALVCHSLDFDPWGQGSSSAGGNVMSCDISTKGKNGIEDDGYNEDGSRIVYVASQGLHYILGFELIGPTINIHH